MHHFTNYSVQEAVIYYGVHTYPPLHWHRCVGVGSIGVYIVLC